MLGIVVIDSGTDCADSLRFWAVTVISCSISDGLAVSAADARTGIAMAAMPSHARYVFSIRMIFSPHETPAMIFVNPSDFLDAPHRDPHQVRTGAVLVRELERKRRHGIEA